MWLPWGVTFPLSTTLALPYTSGEQGHEKGSLEPNCLTTPCHFISIQKLTVWYLEVPCLQKEEEQGRRDGKKKGVGETFPNSLPSFPHYLQNKGQVLFLVCRALPRLSSPAIAALSLPLPSLTWQPQWSLHQASAASKSGMSFSLPCPWSDTHPSRPPSSLWCLPHLPSKDSLAMPQQPHNLFGKAAGSLIHLLIDSFIHSLKCSLSTWMSQALCLFPGIPQGTK